MSGNAVRLAWENLRERAGVGGLHYHDLRHEAVSRLFKETFGIAEMSAISGHKELADAPANRHLRTGGSRRAARLATALALPNSG
jgi:integrase